MRLFVSAGEPSGDLHAANFVRSLRQRCPALEVSGFGGERLASAGCDLLYPLANLALVGILPVLAAVPEFYQLLARARAHLKAHRPDVVVLIDYPGFHWWLAGAARKLGIPVIYFVPPQLWAWGGWRAGKMRRLVDEVLCTLPFEKGWYEQRSIPARYIGHPYFDELREQALDADFLAQQRSKPGPVVGILPGSRRQELHHNVPSLLRAARLVHRRRPDVRFLVACLKEEHARTVSAALGASGVPAEAHHGRTPEIIQLAHSCMSVSGSVGLELLYRGTPAVVTYRANWPAVQIAHVLKRCEHISLVNLLAGRVLFPEYFGWRCMAEQMAGHVLHWLEDARAHEALRDQLATLKERVAVPGACDRAAEAVLELVRGQRRAAA